MNRYVLFFFIMLGPAVVPCLAAANKPNDEIAPHQLPGIVDAKLPPSLMNVSTATKTGPAAGLAPAVTGQAVAVDAAAVVPPPSDTVSPARPEKNTAAAKDIVTKSTATVAVPQKTPAQVPDKKEPVPAPAVTAVPEVTPPRQDPAPAVAAVKTVKLPMPDTEEPPFIASKTTQQVLLEAPATSQTTPQIEAVLTPPKAPAPPAGPEPSPAKEETSEALPSLAPSATDVQEQEVTASTTVETGTGMAEEKDADAEGPVLAPEIKKVALPEVLEKPATPVLSQEPAALKPAPVPAVRKEAPPAPAVHVSAPLPVSRPLPKKEETKDASRETLARAYRVAAGDTLPLLAERYYGDKSEWFRIYEANKDHIEKGSLQKGQVLIIP